MNPRLTKTTLHKLFKEWHWKQLRKRKYVGNLIFTSTGSFRKDMRVVQNVGKPNVKFKFEVGSYIGGSPTTTPRHFSISTTGKKERISWMALPNDDLFLRIRTQEGVWQTPIKIPGFFEDPTNILDEELEFLEFLYPGVCVQIEDLLPGLHGVDAALKERFTGLRG